MTAPPTGSPQALQVFVVWRGLLHGYKVWQRPTRVTIGPAKGATFPLPQADGYPARFPLLRPRPAGGHWLRLGPGMRGKLTLAGKTMSAEDVLAGPPAPRRFSFGAGSPFRDIAVEVGDHGTLAFPGVGDIRLSFGFVDAPERVPPVSIWTTEPFLVRIFGAVALLLSLVLGGAMALWKPTVEQPWTQLRAASVMAAVRNPPPDQEMKKTAEELKKKEEEATAKAAKQERGKLGRADAPKRETVIPKGREDALRDKVAKKGLLGIIGSSKPGGSGLSKLFTASSDVDQALNGLAGAKLAVGRGAGGLSTSGAGVGGGGTGTGRIYGTGDIDTGGGRGGHGKGPSFGGHKEAEAQVSVTTGDADTSGGLSKEQVNRVVRAHQAAIKYCYEKELQRQPALAGKIDLTWVILPDGSVQKAGVANTSMKNPAVEGCMVRQVKQWQFPKSDGQTVVGTYPFLFKGSV